MRHYADCRIHAFRDGAQGDRKIVNPDVEHDPVKITAHRTPVKLADAQVFSDPRGDAIFVAEVPVFTEAAGIAIGVGPVSGIHHDCVDVVAQDVGGVRTVERAHFDVLAADHDGLRLAAENIFVEITGDFIG